MLIVDTGPLVATADKADPDHQKCLALLEAHPGPLVTTSMVVTEAGWLIRRGLDATAEAAIYRSIADGEIQVEALTSQDWARMSELITTYATWASTPPTPASSPSRNATTRPPSRRSTTEASAWCAPPTVTPSN